MVSYLKDGFPQQRMRVLPRPLIAQISSSGLSSRLLVTDAGYFPHAARHGRSRPHGAPEAVVLACTDGLGWCDIDGSTLRVGRGEAIVLPPGVSHLYRADASNPWTLWWFHVVGQDLPELLAPFEPGRRVVALHDPVRITHGMEQVMQALERDESAPSLRTASGAAWHVLAQLGAEHLMGPRDEAGPVQRTREYLVEHLAEPISLTDVAAHIGLSASHLSAVFRQATGGGVMDYLKRTRMGRARVMLLTTRDSIGEISRSVGYQDEFYFSRQFRAVNGVSPSAFRKASRAEEL
ncbi:AraC family transcriptional regulator [Zhihengliuella flava]|uniref:AraC-like DNA-binding protein n=1 Tax=Zhihengliuella flava TaxID=1285193 RepID=A0A931DDZ1_9MICC|nr:AraC family transcriptional regulator [Zhihengliuella flava]MBG6085050.1 AraC-like DNA-binding protein [Zhihengliuella flava]